MRRLDMALMVGMGLILMTVGVTWAEVKAGKDKVSLELSGQVNRALLIANDGEDTEFYNVDNDSSSTRFRIIGKYKSEYDFTVGAKLDIQLESNSTLDVNQNNKTVGGDPIGLRIAEVWFDTPYGTLFLGQGSTASDGAAEADLSGTFLVAYSGPADIAGGILFFDDTLNVLTDTSVGDVFYNLDGARDDRIAYHTPVFGPGLRLSAALVTDDKYDFALNFANDDIAGLQIAAVISYYKTSSIDDGIIGSISVLHNSGVNVTFAAGGVNDLDNSDAEPTFWYVKLGYSKKVMPWGQTSLVIDYYSGDEIAGVQGDEARSVGFGIVQVAESIGTEFYLGLRNYDLERDNANLNNIFASIIGARVKF